MATCVLSFALIMDSRVSLTLDKFYCVRMITGSEIQ